MKQRKFLIVFRSILRILVFPMLICQILAGKTGYVYLCVLTLVLMELPGWTERRLGVAFPGTMEALLLLFIFSSEILGEIRGCYVRYPCWDLILHGFSGFFFASVGYVLPELTDRLGSGEKCTFRLIFAVCFSLSVGVLWEFVEWGADAVFGLDMQKDSVINTLHSVCLSPGEENRVGILCNIRKTVMILADGSIRTMEGYLDIGLHDTMEDLLADLAGAAVFGFLSRGKFFAANMIPKFVGKEER